MAASNLFRVFEVSCSVRERLIGNFPANPEALKWVVQRQAKKDKLTEAEAEQLHEEVVADYTNGVAPYIEEEAGGESVKNVFLRDDEGIYLVPRHVRGWLKETFKMLGVRGYREAVNHGVFVEPTKIYLMRDGKKITKPDGEVVRPIQVITRRGPRSGIKVAEYIEAPCYFSFKLKVIEKVAKALFNNLDAIAEVGGNIGFLGDRSFQEGQCDVEIRQLY